MTDYTGLQFGKYRLQEKIGEGGFADVYRGEHVDLRLLAAVKILKTQLNQSDLDKFRDEAQMLADLQHPHIIRILDYEKSSSNRPPFLILEYMAYGALIKYQGTPQPPQLILPHIMQIADALDYLHNQQKLHLDVKPANILLKNESEAFLSDFGIARSRQGRGQDGMSEVIGSVHYIAPEYLLNHPGPASDQYSLAVVVYELLSGVCPFTGSIAEIQRMHIEDEPPPLQAKIPTLSPAIWPVLQKALAKDPRQRFHTVTDFANALEKAILDSQKIPTVPLAPPSSFPGPPPSIGDFPKTVPIKPLQGPVSTTTQPINRGGAIPRAYSAATRYVFEGHKGEVYSVSWAADSRHLASASMDRTIRIWSIDTNKTVDIYTYLRSIKVVAWSYDSRYIAAMSRDQIVTIRDTQTKAIITTYEAHHTSGMGLAFSLAWSPTSTYIASAGDGNKICIWDATLGSDRIVYRVHSGDYVTALSWSSDGRYLASGSNDKTLQIYDVAARKIVTTHDGYRGEISALAWSPDDHYLASASLDEVKIWNTQNEHLSPAVYRHKTVNSLTWSPDGRYLASAGDDSNVDIRDVTNLQLLLTYTEHLAPVPSVAWAPDGRYLASCDEDKRVCVWKFV